MAERESFDVAVIGGGIGGTILARNGVRVVCLEGGSHPRFAIGEATVPDSTLGMRVLATRYGVPELLNLSNYRSIRAARRRHQRGEAKLQFRIPP